MFRAVGFRDTDTYSKGPGSPRVFLQQPSV